ncbi:MAG: hypothetical protein SFV19_12335 [Rhodospirillaceae bacterium]|nr:hypothetical protein [Rhodospirillaceae bacterium]
MDRLEKFFRHWQSIPRSGLVPRLADYLERPNPELQPWTLILDVEDSTLPTRLFATALVTLVGADLTKTDHLALFSKDQHGDAMRRHKLMAIHPCGMYSEAVAQTLKGLTYAMSGLALPLARENGGHSVVRIIVPSQALATGDTFATVKVQPPAVKWMDIGAGVPD